MGADTGRAAIIGEAIGAAAAELGAVKAAADGEQWPLFDIPTRFCGVRALDRPHAAEKVERAAEAHRRGRPAGASNKSTAELRKWLLARGVHPLEQLMRYSMHTPESLAVELDCSLLEAMNVLVGLWRELAPYFASKVPPTDDAGNVVPFMQFNFGDAGGARSAAPGAPPWLAFDADQAEQKQEVSVPAAMVSHATVSHGGDK